MDEQMVRLAAELEAARAEAGQHAERAARAEETKSQHKDQLAIMRQEHDAAKRQLESQAASLSSRLADAETALAGAEQQEAASRESLAHHEGSSQKGTARTAALQVCALYQFACLCGYFLRK
jgi:hypothetical protein